MNITFVGGPWEGRVIPEERLPPPDPTGARGFTERDAPHLLHYYDPDPQCPDQYQFKYTITIVRYVGGPFDGLVVDVNEVTTPEKQCAACPYDNNTRFALYEREGLVMAYKGYRYASQIFEEMGGS